MAFTGGNTLSLTGTGEPGATVTLLSGTNTVAKAVINSHGNWKMAFIPSLSTRAFSAVETDIAGNVSATNGSALVGTIFADKLTSTTGNDILIGGTGWDTFWFNAQFGNDIIDDFKVGTGRLHEAVNFHGVPELNSFASVMSHTTQVGKNTVISLGADNTVQLNNVKMSSLRAANFTFA